MLGVGASVDDGECPPLIVGEVEAGIGTGNRGSSSVTIVSIVCKGSSDCHDST